MERSGAEPLIKPLIIRQLSGLADIDEAHRDGPAFWRICAQFVCKRYRARKLSGTGSQNTKRGLANANHNSFGLLLKKNSEILRAVR